MPQPVHCTDTKCNALVRLLQAGVNDSCTNCKIPHPLYQRGVSQPFGHARQGFPQVISFRGRSLADQGFPRVLRTWEISFSLIMRHPGASSRYFLLRNTLRRIPARGNPSQVAAGRSHHSNTPMYVFVTYLVARSKCTTGWLAMVSMNEG